MAELVTRAFSQNINQPNSAGDRRQLTERPSAHLEDFDEIPQGQQNGFSPNSDEQSIDDNVIVGSGVNTGTSGVDHGFLGKMLGILGMDTGKIGALAINGIIFIAQMVCIFFGKSRFGLK